MEFGDDQSYAVLRHISMTYKAARLPLLKLQKSNKLSCRSHIPRSPSAPFLSCLSTNKCVTNHQATIID